MKIARILTVLILVYGNIAMCGGATGADMVKISTGSCYSWSIAACTRETEAGKWQTKACEDCKKAVQEKLENVLPITAAAPRWMTKRAARRREATLLYQKHLASLSGCGAAVAAVEQALRRLTLSAPVEQERPFVQWSKPLVFSHRGHKQLMKFFGLLYSKNYTLSVLEEKWHNLVCTEKIYISTDRLVSFLYRVGVQLRAVTADDIFARVMVDSRIVWLMEKINTLVRNEDISFSKRELFSADCAEEHARLYLAKYSLEDELEFLTKIIRMNLMPWHSIPRPQMVASLAVIKSPFDCLIC
ncbi:hypothetical protein FJ365_00330 [Candidatus Dependentiae bacterium]|nr:hypothetical protein [Candidatus Dependentiae bacterium]